MDNGRSSNDTAVASGGQAAAAPAPPLIMVSNRGPVQYRTNDEGRIEQQCNPGGVATALAALAPGRPIRWIANTSGPVDRALAAQGATIELDADMRVRLVATPQDALELFYGVFANPILWFVQHGMADRLESDDLDARTVEAWQRGYLPVNQAFAETVIEELDRAGRAGVMLHDYHFYAAPLFIRNRRPEAVLQHFVHIPWPTPEAWRTLRRPIVQSICEGLLANDSVVFQTDEFARNFIDTCRAYLDPFEADASHVRHAGRTTRIWTNPVSVDVWELRRELSTAEARDYQRTLAAPEGVRTIVRVDRLDPAKNAAAGFRAFGRLLTERPEWRGRVRFLAFLVPSRGGVREYQRYAREVFDAADDVNARFGTDEWTPVSVFHEHNRVQALAAMSLYDVLLVNSLADGMNLVAKEGPAVNRQDGVLVLSEAAGASRELGSGALTISPDDVEGTAAALYRALEMEPEERRERARRLRDAVHRHDLRRWFRLLLEDLDGGSEAPRDAGAMAVPTRLGA